MGEWVGSGRINKNQINLELIEIIQFCLKICDLLKHPHLWVGVQVVGWMGGLIYLDLIKIIQLWTFWTFFWTFYLNHLSALWGYFYPLTFQIKVS